MCGMYDLHVSLHRTVDRFLQSVTNNTSEKAVKMSKFRDAVRRLKNLLKINNVYDCARPFLLVLGIFGLGATSIRKTEGAYSVHNTRYSTLITVIMSGMYTPYYIVRAIYVIFRIQSPSLFLKVNFLIAFFLMFSTYSTINVGYMVTFVSRKRLDRVFHIIHTIDSQLEDVNIRVKHWQITLKVMVLALATFDYVHMARKLRLVPDILDMIPLILPFTFHLFFVWLMLFIVIIHERFVCLNKLLQQNARVTNIEIVGERSRRDNYILRRISLARRVHEQLTEAVRLFSDSFRYMVLGCLVTSIIQILLHSLLLFITNASWEVYSILFDFLRIVVLLLICQANKNQRRVLSARLRHLCAYETNREIIRQVQQYIMYNTFSTTGIIDLQFTDMDNVLLLTIINVIVANMLIIYSYARE